MPEGSNRERDVVTEARYEGVVLLGFPRSGTTMLRRLLDAHPDLCCPPETHILRGCAAFLTEEDSPLGLPLGVAPSLRFVGIEPADVVDRVRQLAFGLLQDICRKYGKPIWVEKSAFDIFHLDRLEPLLGDHCRFVWITRHAGDVIASVKEYVSKAEIYYPELHEYVRAYPAPVEAFAHAWVDTQERMFRFAEERPSTCLRLRYEDLVTSPEAELDRILAFLGLSSDAAALVRSLRETPGAVGYGDWKTYERDTVSADSVGRFASTPAAVLARIAGIVNPTMIKLGYDPIAVAHRELRADPVRRFQLGLAVSHSAAVRAGQKA